MSIDPKYYTEDVKTVKRIDFCVFTNKEVKSYSSVSSDPFGINLPESYENYEPKKGGLVDLRLGTCDIYLNCLTCGLNTNDCPGHFGHTVLADMVFNYGYFQTYLKAVLQCICLQCSKVLVEKTDALYKKLMNKKTEARFNETKNLTKNTTYCYNCGTPVGKIKKEEKESTASIRLILERDVGIQLVDEKTGDTNETVKKITKILTPRDCYNILRNLSDVECYLLGFNPKVARPEDFIIENFPIPPTIIRPTAKIDFMQASTMEDSLTLKIADIINSNKRVRQQMDKEIISNELSTYNQDISNLLQYHIATYFDNESISLPRSEFKTGGKPIKSISDRIRSKGGRVRCNLMGKRVDFSARSVITSDPYINIDEVGVPKKIAMELTIPEEVTPYNIKYLSDLVKNGRDIYPGANFVFKTIYKEGKTEIQKIDLKYRKKVIQLNIGDTVERHAVNGDYVLFNRQPTLHKPSMMGHKIHVLNRDDINTFRMSVSICGPYNADFDGDEMNIHIAQSIQARNELKRIANVSFQIIGAKDSSPIIGCVQDALTGCYLLTKLDNKISGSEVANFLCNTTSETKYQIDPNKMYTGHEIFSHIIPQGINNIVVKNGKKILEIVDGELKIGTLDKSTLSKVKNSLVHFIWDKYGPDKTRRFIDDAHRLALSFLYYRGFTFGIKDCIVEPLLEQQIKEMVKDKILEYKIALTQYENDIDQLNPSVVEESLSAILNAFSADVGNIVMKNLTPDNNLFVCVDSKSKGSIMNVQHMMGCVGQKSVEGVRIKKKVENRTLPIFHRDDDTPEARGFIKNSFFEGVSSFEFFYDAMASREGLIDTAIKSVTWETPIIIIENGSAKYTEIGKWIDNLLDNNQNKIQRIKERDMELMDTKDIYIPTTDYNGNVSWGEVTAITRHDPGTELYEIKTDGGRNVIVTESKSLLIWNNETNEFKEMLTPDIKVGDFVPVTAELLEPPIIQQYIDLSNYLSKNEYLYGSEYYKTSAKQTISEMSEKFELNYDNGIFIGLFLANGSLTDSCVRITNSYDNIKNFIKSWYNKHSIRYNEKIKINKIGEKTNTIKCNSTILSKFLNKLTYNNDGGNKYVPNEAFIAPEYFVCGLLNGYFSGNGFITKNSIYTRSKSKRLIEGINMLCSRINVYGKVHTRIIKKNNLGTKYIKPSYTLRISAQWANMFSKKISLLEENKNKKMKSKNWSTNHINFKQYNNVVLDKIVEINIISTENYKKVYDLTIPKTFNFGLANGLQVRDTAKTGYVQRQLIKGLEDLIIKYDNSNRNSRNILIQLLYGGTGIDQTKQSELEIKLISSNNTTVIDTYNFTNEEIKELEKIHNIKNLSKLNNEYTNRLLKYRDELRLMQTAVYNDYQAVREKFMLPVNIARLTQDYSKEYSSDKISNLNPIEIYEELDKLLDSPELRLIPGLNKNNKMMLIDDKSFKFLFEIAIHNFLCPKKCIYKYKFVKEDFYTLIKEIKLNFIKAIIQPGEMNGIVAAQSIGEPTSQMTLNTKHSAGVAASSSGLNMGVSRIEELLHFSRNIKTPQMEIYFDKSISTERSKVNKIASYLTHLTIRDLIDSAEIYYETGKSNELSEILKTDNTSNPFFINNQKTEISSLPFVFRIKMNMEKMYNKEVTLLDIKTKFYIHWQKNFTNLKTLKKNEKDIVTKISKCAILSNTQINNQIIHIRFNMSTFNYNLITDFLKIVLDSITLKGIDNIAHSELVNELKVNFNNETGAIESKKEFKVNTRGINFEKILYVKNINNKLTTSNDIATIYRLYGIEATRQVLINEFITTFKAGSADVSSVHMSVLVDTMTHMGFITSIDRHGLNKVDSEPLTRASFEQTMDHFINAAVFNEKDHLKSVSSRVMLGRVIPGGTGCFELILDTNKLENSEYTKNENGGRITFDCLEEEKMFIDIIKHGFFNYDFFLPN